MSKHTVVTTNGKRGGNLVGKPHKNKQRQDVGGIKAVVTDANNRPVELEGGEVIINKEASKKHWKELSRINQSAGNGVPINKPIDPHDEDPEEYAKGGKIEFNPNQLPNKWILNYAKNIKKNHPEIWKKGGNIYGNQAFENLLRVSERGYWLDSEEWFYVKWRSFVARHKGDFRIAGVVAMLKWVDKVDKGWQYMKDLIEEEIKKRSDKKSGWKTKKTERMSGGGEVVIDETIANNQMTNPKEGMAIVNILEENDMFANVRYVLEVHKENGEIVGVNYGIPNGFSFFLPIGQFKNQFVPATQKQVNRSKGKLFAKGGQTERQQAKIGYTMREFKEGNLKTSYGETVTDEKQALAIALSKAGVEKKQYGGEIEVGLKGFYNGKKRIPITVTKTNAKNIYFRNEETGEIKRSERKNFERLFESGMGVTNSLPTHAMPIIDDTPSPKQDDKGSAIPSTDPSTWDATFKVGDRVKIRIDFTTDSTTNTYDYAKIGSYFSKENDFKIISKTSEKEMIRPENPTGTLYTLSNGQNWEGKDLELFVTQQSNKQQTKQQPTSKTQVNYYELFKSKNEVIEMSNNETMAVQLGRFVKMADEDRLMRMEDIQDFKKAIDKLG